MTGVKWLNDKEQTLWRHTKSFHHLLDLAVERQLLRDAGLSSADYAVLVTLSECEKMAMRARDIGVDLGWDRSRVSHQVRRMENRGLVRKVACVTDGRGTIIELTEVGLEAIKNSAPKHVEQVRRIYIDLLSDEEKTILNDAYERVMKQIEIVEGIALPSNSSLA